MFRPLLFAALLSAALLTATAEAAKPSVCKRKVITNVLLNAGKLSPDSADNGEVVDLIRCGDVTNDGRADATFTVSSGGTAGDTHFGVLRGGTFDLVTYRSAYKVGVARHDSRSFDAIQPHYGPNDPNCCPSYFEVRRYTWTGTRFRAGKARKLADAPARFYRQ